MQVSQHDSDFSHTEVEFALLASRVGSHVLQKSGFEIFIDWLAVLETSAASS